MEREIWGEKDRLIKCVLTGPESSGKTTLCEDLAKELNCLMVPEFARQYLATNGLEYQESDLVKIAQGQQQSEQVMEQKARLQDYSILLLDTNILTIKIWSEFKYGRLAREIKSAYNKSNPDLYVLCSPDIPWEEDPMRESPSSRDELYQIYLREIKASRFPFIEVQGNRKERVKMVLQYFKTNKILPD